MDNTCVFKLCYSFSFFEIQHFQPIVQIEWNKQTNSQNVLFAALLIDVKEFQSLEPKTLDSNWYLFSFYGPAFGLGEWNSTKYSTSGMGQQSLAPSAI